MADINDLICDFIFFQFSILLSTGMKCVIKESYWCTQQRAEVDSLKENTFLTCMAGCGTEMKRCQYRDCHLIRFHLGFLTLSGIVQDQKHTKGTILCCDTFLILSCYLPSTVLVPWKLVNFILHLWSSQSVSTATNAIENKLRIVSTATMYTLMLFGRGTDGGGTDKLTIKLNPM